MLPYFLIVGTMKSGTTTLCHYLKQHPQIFMPDFEIHFFDNPNNFSKGIDWYRSIFPQGKENRIMGEKTPAYCLKESYPQKISQLMPDIKLIWMFRNPIFRTYSNYWHAVRVGAELKSFKKALSLEEIRLNKGKEHLLYTQRSMYCDQISAYNKYFSRDQQLYLLFEDFIEKPMINLQKICKFLHIDLSFHIQDKTKQNIAKTPKSKVIQRILRFLKVIGKPKGNPLFKPNSIIPRFYHKISAKNKKDELGYPPMEPEIHHFLYTKFSPWYSKFEMLTDLSTKKWRKH